MQGLNIIVLINFARPGAIHVCWFVIHYMYILVMIIKEVLNSSVHVQLISTTCKSLGLSDQFVCVVNRDYVRA